ncbi:MAG TPA: thiol-disulfide oxidoreductase DCC family protein [Longimicrobium sp.]|jgi:predicted DCC family thiol-disulfide oxidoreductase YuxK
MPEPAGPPADDAGPIVLYDGVCGLCNRSVQLILRNDRRGRFRFAALQSDAGKAMLREHGMPEDALDTVVLVEGGRAYRKSRAACRIARRMDAPWPVLWPLLVVPRPVADFFYDLVARHRYRIFGKTEACMLPPPEVRARFLG